MKTNNLIFCLLFIVVSLLFSCNSVKEGKNNTCEDANKLSAELVDNYYRKNDTSDLVSALEVIDETICECEIYYYTLLTFRKLGIYSELREFSLAIDEINSFEKEFVDKIPYTKQFLLNRFYAMQSQFEGNIDERNEYVRNIITELDVFYESKSHVLDSLVLLENVEDILNHELTMKITQLYYYRSITEGIDSIEVELADNCINKNWNEDYCDYIIINLHEDFLVFKGL